LDLIRAKLFFHLSVSIQIPCLLAKQTFPKFRPWEKKAILTNSANCQKYARNGGLMTLDDSSYGIRAFAHDRDLAECLDISQNNNRGAAKNA